MTDIVDATRRSQNMAAIRSRDTKPEMFIRKALFADGFRYRVAPNHIAGHPDLYLKRYNLAIFVHGCFWHRHRDCQYAYNPKSRVEFWQKKFTTNIERDEVVRRELEARGIRMLIIWECAIKKAQKKQGDPKALIMRIEEFIRSDTAYGEEG